MSTWGRSNGEQTPKKNWTLDEARGKLETYCSYQERCSWEVRRKLVEKGIQGKATETLLEELTASGFLDDARYAMSFARGKFRIRKWGRGRIVRELKLRQINASLIQAALAELDPEEYFTTLQDQAEKKWEKTKEKDPFKKRYSVGQYLMSKGFEQDLIREALSNLSS